jgi:hypothetical protein
MHSMLSLRACCIWVIRHTDHELVSVIASLPNPAEYLTRTLNRHRERSVAIHDFWLHGLPRFARSDEVFVYGWLAMTISN